MLDSMHNTNVSIIDAVCVVVSTYTPPVVLLSPLSV